MPVVVVEIEKAFTLFEAMVVVELLLKARMPLLKEMVSPMASPKVPLPVMDRSVRVEVAAEDVMPVLEVMVSAVMLPEVIKMLPSLISRPPDLMFIPLVTSIESSWSTFWERVTIWIEDSVLRSVLERELLTSEIDDSKKFLRELLTKASFREKSDWIEARSAGITISFFSMTSKIWCGSEPNLDTPCPSELSG